MTSPTVPPQLRSGLRAVYGVVLALLPTRLGDRLRDLVARTRARWPQLDGPSGGRVRVPGPLDHPVVLVVAVGCASIRLRQAVDGLSGVPVRPVWLVDTPLPGDLADQVIEWLPPAVDLDRFGLDADALRRSRLHAVERRYRPKRVVVIGPEGPLPDPVLIVPSPS